MCPRRSSVVFRIAPAPHAGDEFECCSVISYLREPVSKLASHPSFRRNLLVDVSYIAPLCLALATSQIIVELHATIGCIEHPANPIGLVKPPLEARAWAAKTEDSFVRCINEVRSALTLFCSIGIVPRCDLRTQKGVVSKQLNRQLYAYKTKEDALKKWLAKQ